jgi:hypothetical protein
MNLSNSFRKQIKYRYAEKKNRLRTSCASAVGRGYFKKMKIEDGAVQPITAAIWFRFAPPKFLLHCVPQKLHIAAERYRPCANLSLRPSGTAG